MVAFELVCWTAIQGSQATSAEGLAEQSGGLPMDSMPSTSASSDIDGEELAVAMASVANDVKVVHPASIHACRLCRRETVALT